MPATVEREKELIARIIAGETNLFHELIRPYERMVYLAILTMVRGVAEDLGFAPAYTPGIPQGHMVTPDEAVREGYAPCNRCMHEALRSAGNATPDFEEEEIVSRETAAK